MIGTYNTTGATTYKYAEVNFGTKSSPISPAPAAPTLTASADNSNWAISRNISVAATNAAGGTLQYRRAGTSAWTTLSLDSAGKVTGNVTENGYYTFRLKVGEYVLTKDVLVEKIDRQSPTAAVGTPAESGTNRTAKAGVYTKITLPITFSDSGSGVKTVQYQWTNTQTTPAGWTTLSLTDAQKQSGTAEISYTASENGETNKYLHIKVTDNVGKTVTAVSAVYKVISQAAVDNHAPKITLTGAPTAWTNDTATLEWKLTDYSGKNYEVILPDGRKAKASAAQGEVWARQNGSYTVKVRDLDYGGENTATADVTYIDTTAPSVTVSTVSDGWRTTAQSVTISASDSQSGVGKKYYKIVTNDQETPGEGLTEFTTSSVSVRENGIWYLYYKIYDQTGDDTVGREANMTEGFVGPIKIDAKTPTLTADAPEKSVSKTAGLEVALKAVYGTSGGTVKVGNSIISALGATANDPGSSNDITKNAAYKINAKGTYQFVLTGGSGKTAGQSLTVYEASFELQGGTGTAPAQLVVKDGFLTQPTAPTKAGNVFQGWYTAAAGGEEWNFAAGKVASDCTLYARWKTDAYTVTFHKNGGMIENESSFTSYTYGTALTLPTPTRTGYTFGGWYENEGCTGTAVTEITAVAAGDKEYWAKWTPQTCQVTFHYHGAEGGNTTAGQNVTYDSKYGTLPVPSRTGYTFKGWYTGENGQGSKVDADTIVKTASAHTLHACWKDETAPDKPVLQDSITLPTGWTNAQDKIPLKTHDGVGVIALLVSVDGGTYTDVSGFSGGTGSINYNYTAVQEGEHKYQFKAVDAAGNFAESDIFTVKLDQAKPVIGTLTYDNAVHLNLWHWIIGKESIVIHVPVTDTGSGVTKISYTLTDRDAAGNLNTSSAVTDTETVTNGEAEIAIAADFRGTITINCRDAAGNQADSIVIGKDAGGVIVEDQAPAITIQADRNVSDTQPTKPDGVAVTEEQYYDSQPALIVRVKDGTDNAITAGLASVTYQVGGDRAKSVPVSSSALQAEVTFTIPASEIPTGITQIRITASDNAGNEAPKSITLKVKGPEKQPGAEIDYREEKLTGLVPGGEYLIGGKLYTADGEGRIPIEESWLGTGVSIVKKGSGSETTDSPAQSLPIPARPQKPTPAGVDVSTAGGTGKLTGLTADTAYEVSGDNGKTWETKTADGSGGITGLGPGTYVVRVKAGTSNFASQSSDPAAIGAYRVTVTFMANGEVYKRISVDYGEALTEIPDIPPQQDGGDRTYIREWCGDQQGTPAVFTGIRADMTVYAVYITAYTVTLEGGADYTLSAQAGSASPVKEGGSFSFRFALADGYRKTGSFAVKVNGVKVELTKDAYTIADIRENKTVTVEGIERKPDEGSANPPSGGGDQGKQPAPEPQPPSPAPEPRPQSPSHPKEQPRPTDTPDSLPEDTREPENTGTPKPTETPAEAEREKGEQPEKAGEQTVPAALDTGKLVISGEPIATGNVEGMTDTRTVLDLENGAVIVTVVCAEQEYTAGVADTIAVANAVLTPGQIGLVNDGETIEIRIDVKDISGQVPEQDKEVIEKGIREYRKEAPGLTLGMYVDISMFIRIGEGGWNAVTQAEEPIEVIIGIPEKLRGKDRTYVIIRAHDGVHTLLEDRDGEPDTITVRTALFSSYAIAYVQTKGMGHKCGLCHICPTFLGICCFVWLAIIVLLVILAWIILHKRKGQELHKE